jgi:hypothetical protein
VCLKTKWKSDFLGIIFLFSHNSVEVRDKNKYYIAFWKICEVFTVPSVVAFLNYVSASAQDPGYARIIIIVPDPDPLPWSRIRILHPGLEQYVLNFLLISKKQW